MQELEDEANAELLEHEARHAAAEKIKDNAEQEVAWYVEVAGRVMLRRTEQENTSPAERS